MNNQSRILHIAVSPSGHWAVDEAIRWVVSSRLNDPRYGGYCVLRLRYEGGVWKGGSPDSERIPDVIFSYILSRQSVQMCCPNGPMLEISLALDEAAFMEQLKKFLDTIELGISVRQD